MYFQFACEQCGKKLKVRDELAGRRVRCPYCHTTISVPTESPESDDLPPLTSGFQGFGTPQFGQAPAAPFGQAPAAPFGQAPAATQPAAKTGAATKRGKKSSSNEQNDGTNVSILLSGVIALVLTIAFYVPLFPMAQADMYLGDLFVERGWVPFATTFLFAWAMVILYLKSRKLRRQREAMLFDVLPVDLSPEITPQNVNRFIEHVQGLPVQPGESFLVTRVQRGLEHFRVRRSNPEVANTLNSLSEIDAGTVDSSYTLLKVFIWAIPILGFIGTVIGISDAVAGFSGNMDASDPAALKQSLNNITGGLATAFDTTLIALVMSMFVMFPASSMQKNEEDLLGAVDEYCNENLIKRLNDGAAGNGGGGKVDNREAIQQAIHAAMAAHHAELQAWTAKLEKIGETVTSQVSKGWQELQASLLEQVNGVVEKQQSTQQEFQTQVETLVAKQQELLTQLQDVQSSMVALDVAHMEEVRTSMSALAGGANEVQQQVAAAMRETSQALDRHFGSLGEGLASLNRVLEELGEKQVVIKSELPARRRGWFSRRNGH